MASASIWSEAADRSGSSIGRTAYACSPETRSRMRLVTSRRRPGAPASSAGSRGAAGHQVLEVVQHQQEFPLFQRTRQRFGRRQIAALWRAERLQDRRFDQVNVRDGGEGHESDAIREGRSQPGGGFQRQPRFSDAARSRERQQARFWAAHLLADRRQVALSPNERGQRGRERSQRPPWLWRQWPQGDRGRWCMRWNSSHDDTSANAEPSPIIRAEVARCQCGRRRLDLIPLHVRPTPPTCRRQERHARQTRDPQTHPQRQRVVAQGRRWSPAGSAMPCRAWKAGSTGVSTPSTQARQPCA